MDYVALNEKTILDKHPHSVIHKLFDEFTWRIIFLNWILGRDSAKSEYNLKMSPK